MTETAVRGDAAPLAPSLASEILGLSQIVLGVSSIDAAEERLLSYGYRVKDRILDLPNPQAKRHFVGDNMAPTHHLSMLMPPVAALPIELVCANVPGGQIYLTPPALEAVLVPPAAREEDIRATVFAAITRDVSTESLPGIVECAMSRQNMIVRAMIVRCLDVSAALEMPMQLGLRIEWIGSDRARVDLRGLMLGSKLSLYFVRSDRVERGCPDQIGLICTTFLCKDAEKMATRLAELGHDVGPRFVLAPFGTTVRVFFVRSASGDMYEFLSVCRSDEAEERKLM